MNTDIKILISAVDKGIKSTISNITAGMQKAATAGKIFSEAIRGTEKASSSLMSSLKGLVAGFAGIQGLRMISGVAREAETAFFTLRDSVEAASREFSDTGDLTYWNDAISELSKNLMVYSESSLKNAVARTIDMTKRLGLSADQMKEVVRISGELAAGKMDVTQAVERVTAALRGEAESAEYLGLTLNDTYVKAWYEANKVTKQAWEDLTDVEKAQIRLKIVVEQTASKMGRAAEYAKTFNGAIDMMKATIEKAVTGNKSLSETMSALAETLRKNQTEIAMLVGSIISIVAKIIEWTLKYKELLRAFAGTVAAVVVIQKLVTVVQGLNVAFAFLTGMSIAAWISELRVAIAALSTSTTLLATAFKGFIAFAAAEGIVNIVRLIAIIREWRQVASEAATKQKEAADLMAASQAKQSEMVKQANADLGMNIKTRGELLKLQREGIVVYDQETGKWKAGEAAKQGAVKGTTTAVRASAKALNEFGKAAKTAYEKAVSEAKKYAKEIERVENEIRQYRKEGEDLIRELGRKTMTDEQQWNDRRKESEEKLVKAKEAIRQKDFEGAKKLIEDSKQLAASLAEEVTKKNAQGQETVTRTIKQTTEIAQAGVKEAIGVMGQLADAEKASFEELKTKAQSAADQIKEIIDLIKQAKEAKIQISAEGLEAIKTDIEAMVKDPKEITVKADAEPARAEIKRLIDGEWKTITLNAEADPTKAERALQMLKDSAASMKMEATVTADTKEANTELKAIKALLASIKSKTVTVTVVKKVKSEGGGGSESSDEEAEELALGGKIHGFGKKDIVPAFLTLGERITNSTSTRILDRIYPGLMAAANRIKSNSDARRWKEKFLSLKGYAAGGMVTPTEAMTLTFNAGSASVPLTVLGSPKVTRGMVMALERELRKMGMTR